MELATEKCAEFSPEEIKVYIVESSDTTGSHKWPSGSQWHEL